MAKLLKSIYHTADGTVDALGEVAAGDAIENGIAGAITPVNVTGTGTDPYYYYIDFHASNNFQVNLTQNGTLNLGSNHTAGQSGSIFLVQDSGGTNTLSYTSQWHFIAGQIPSVSLDGNAVSRIDYIIQSDVVGSEVIHAVMSVDVKTTVSV
jgi:hypothetical protein